MTIGERFSAALHQLGAKNKEISEIFDVSSQQISNLKKSNTINHLIGKICAHYGININWIVSGRGEMFTSKSNVVATKDFTDSRSPLSKYFCALEEIASARDLKEQLEQDVKDLIRKYIGSEEAKVEN